jgi:hypothetical protein
LRKTPGAINHLVNPDHPNKPTETMMELLRLIIACERPGLVNAQTCESTEGPKGAKPNVMRLSRKERVMIERMRRLPPRELETVYAVMEALLRGTVGKDGKTGGS